MARAKRGCNVYTALSVLLLLCGAAITALSVYVTILVTSLPVRETSYWTGVPLIITAIVSLYFSAAEVDVYTGNFRAFCIRGVCFIFNLICLLISAVASIFPAYHASVVAQLVSCRLVSHAPATCRCLRHESGQLPRWYVYETERCATVHRELYPLLIALAVLNLVAATTSFIFLFCLWRSRYGYFYSGLRFFSYSAAHPGRHPWSNPLPYVATSEPMIDGTEQQQQQPSPGTSTATPTTH